MPSDPLPDLQSAIRLHQSGHLVEAQAAYQRILAARPDHPQALHLMGLLAHQRGDNARAIALIERAVALAPGNPEFHSNRGEIRRRMGDFPAAIAAFQQAIAAGAKSIHTQHNLALAYKDSGQLPEAIAAFRRVVAAKPDHADAQCNLGTALFENHQPQEAITAFRAAIAARPNFPQAFKNLGTALRAAGAPDRAADAFRQAIALAPEDAAAHQDLALCLLAHGQAHAAIEAARQAVRLAPHSADAHRTLGAALAEAGQPHDAVAAYQQALRLRPDSPVWRFELAAITADGSVPNAPPEYVRTLFDAYAPRFDEHLVKDLAYRVPEDLRQMVLAVAPGEIFDILDLGCGTGLVGMQFRPHARRLVGVDLSPVMIRRAAERRIYDQLMTADIREALHANPAAFDLILAADVFIYVGDLADVFPAAATALRAGGLLAFSIEHTDAPGFVLHHRRRYAHSLTYIRDLATTHGLAELLVKDTIIRRDPPTPTTGHLVVLRKSR